MFKFAVINIPPLVAAGAFLFFEGSVKKTFQQKLFCHNYSGRALLFSFAVIRKQNETG